MKLIHSWGQTLIIKSCLKDSTSRHWVSYSWTLWVHSQPVAAPSSMTAPLGAECSPVCGNPQGWSPNRAAPAYQEGNTPDWPCLPCRNICHSKDGTWPEHRLMCLLRPTWQCTGGRASGTQLRKEIRLDLKQNSRSVWASSRRDCFSALPGSFILREGVGSLRADACSEPPHDCRTQERS